MGDADGMCRTHNTRTARGPVTQWTHNGQINDGRGIRCALGLATHSDALGGWMCIKRVGKEMGR